MRNLASEMKRENGATPETAKERYELKNSAEILNQFERGLLNTNLQATSGSSAPLTPDMQGIKDELVGQVRDEISQHTGLLNEIQRRGRVQAQRTAELLEQGYQINQEIADQNAESRS